MKIVEINVCPSGSTGTIMLQIAEQARQRQHVVYTFSRKWRRQPLPPEGHRYFGTFLENAFHQVAANLTGYSECYSYFGTRALIRQLKRISPDVIHLHNLHGWYIDLPQLFRYMKRHHIRVVWTLHDCWSFTGQCPHFLMAGCNKWQTGCHGCSQHDRYPATRVDRTKTMWRRKKDWFTGVENLTLVTPSYWLAGLVRQSYLKDYPLTVIRNGIDLSVFKPTENDFSAQYRCEGKHILLGVAADWGERKGLDVFVELSRRLDDSYQIVLVGTRDDVDRLLPDNVISIHRTANPQELAEIYTAADVFVNPTREEVLGLVNIEALACGTPVITFDAGGSPECIDESCGSVVPVDCLETLVREIVRVCETQPYSQAACIQRAVQFDRNATYAKYIRLYEEMSGNESSFHI